MANTVHCQCGSRYDRSVSPGGMCPKCLFQAGRDVDSKQTDPMSNPLAPANQELAPKPDAIAALFPDLEIIELIGQGGMGFVYKARQNQLGRIVAVKLLSPSLMQDPAFAERFSREAQTMVMLSHPNIISIFDFGQREDYYFLIMEFVDGLNLRQLAQSTQLEPVEAMQLVPQLCDALQYAHDQGVVHRDIKPENILISQDGQIKVADFGLAKLTGTATPNFTLTQTQQIMGTINYMAPEQREKPNEVDHRADIYSLGVVIYELLTGELPLGRFAPPSRKVQINVEIDEVVLRALEKEPGLRYQQASEFKTGFQQVDHKPPCLNPVDDQHARQANLHDLQQATKNDDQSVAVKVVKMTYVLVSTLVLAAGVLAMAFAETIGRFENQVRLLGVVLIGVGAFMFVGYGLYESVWNPQKPRRSIKENRRRLAEFIYLSLGVGVLVTGIVTVIGSSFVSGPREEELRFIGFLILFAGVFPLVVFVVFQSFFPRKFGQSQVVPPAKQLLTNQSEEDLESNSLFVLLPNIAGMFFGCCCAFAFVAGSGWGANHLIDQRLAQLIGVGCAIFSGFFFSIGGMLASWNKSK